MIIANITDDTELISTTDYGSFTNLESKHSPPVQDLVKLGPGLSPARSHLALLTAQFLDLVTYKYPKDYKPSKQPDIAAKDHLYNVEMLSRIHNSATTFLHDQSTPARLTSAEHSLYTATALLSGILATSLTHPRSNERLPAVLVDTITALKNTLSNLRTSFLSGPSPASNQSELFSYLTNMHTLSCLRDTAVAIKQSVVFLQAWHETEQIRDRSGKSGCHKDIISAMKALDGLATKTLGEVKGRIKMLKDKLGEGAWLDRLLEWTFGPEESDEDEIVKAVESVVGGRGGAEEWVGKVLESWNEGVTGWTLVKME
jgi:N-terminal acetyltransferase B complex non-catalytic subunit